MSTPDRFMRRFLRRDGGAVTVETILWIPMFIFIFGLMLFHGQAKVLMVAQNANRQYSIGNVTTEAATEVSIESQLAAMNIQANATTVEVAGVARTVVSVPAIELQVLGFFNVFQGLNLTITAEHMIENWEV